MLGQREQQEQGSPPAAPCVIQPSAPAPRHWFPHCRYRDDAAPLYAALLDYATAIIQAHYGEGAKAAAAIKADAQLIAFLADLSEGGDGEIQSFPGPAHVKSVEDLARVIAKVGAAWPASPPGPWLLRQQQQHACMRLGSPAPRGRKPSCRVTAPPPPRRASWRRQCGLVEASTTPSTATRCPTTT